jgi:hypothetical protein
MKHNTLLYYLIQIKSIPLVNMILINKAVNVVKYLYKETWATTIQELLITCLKLN